MTRGGALVVCHYHSLVVGSFVVSSWCVACVRRAGVADGAVNVPSVYAGVVLARLAALDLCGMCVFVTTCSPPSFFHFHLSLWISVVLRLALADLVFVVCLSWLFLPVLSHPIAVPFGVAPARVTSCV